jgi:hypothetical protein
VLPLLVGSLVLGEATAVFAATFNVKAVRVSGGWRWRDASGDQHTYINRGDYIRWRNPTSVRHNVVAYGGNWSYARTLNPGQRVRRRFGTAGNFRYRCTRHSALVNGRCSGQCGIIHV